MDVENSSRSTEPLVPTAKVDSADTILAEHGCAHDARLDGNIEVCLIEDGNRMLGQDTSNGHKLGVPCAVQGAVRLVHASADDVAIVDKDTAHGRLVALESQFGLE